MSTDPAEVKLGHAKWYIIVGRGSMAFRWGPFEDGPAVGKLMEQCHREGIPALFTADMGQEFDWELARDLRGHPSVVDHDLLTACKAAAELYDHLALGSLEAAAKYGDGYEPPTEEDMLKVREKLAIAIAKAEKRA